MAFWGAIGGALETAGRGVIAGAQLGLNKHSNNAMERAASRTAKDATRVGCDVGGFATNTVAPVIQGAGHGIAAGACSVADAATFGQIDDLSKARRDQEKRAGKKFEQAEGGMARALGHSNPSFNSKPGNLGAWMANISDSTKVADLFLPGTHDTVARMGGDIGQCQNWSVEEQLRSGCRAFDLRFRMVGDAMCGHHGPIYQDINFGGVADQFEDFLRHNPSEVIFVSITGNGCSHDSCRNFWELLQEKMSRRGQDNVMWQRFSTDLAKATLGQLRRRIVAFDGAGNVTRNLDMQNEWSTGDADWKWEQVFAHARRPRKEKTLYCSFLSAVGQDGMTLCTPSGMAYKVNGKAMQTVGKFNPGIYLMDYPGEGLVRRMVERNF
mmetsp:Transcript_8757/g.17363  ORF Transcript_8757/g.17363 Transcript_8757/m.17363 type:complete len:382 (-) Transcript_8757:330-1475(-)